MIGPSGRRSWLLTGLLAAAVALVMYAALRAQLFERALSYGYQVVHGEEAGTILIESATLHRARSGSDESDVSESGVNESGVNESNGDESGVSGSAWQLDLDAEIALPPAVIAGLDNGLPLHFILELAVVPGSGSRMASWLRLDERHRRRYSLVYYSLTRHYRVHEEHSGYYRNYRSLRSALVGLGEFRSLSFDELATEPERFAVRLWLDTSRLPLPLQPLLRSPWRLASNTFEGVIDG
ncbi:MAG: hypothetical protein CSB44_11150 [Gammaproteobacteria bacterium]|nr:MAG: hypothetical protein CSB44_11150 [Gammaproteobacteria bacterium]PIE37044.1 MAG: hypothetical protein CSA54_02215 [Gammaproteobacteria bacterium]